MTRKFTSFQVDNFKEFKIKMLSWANQFSIFCLLDNNQYNFSDPSFECLLAVGSITKLQLNAGNAFNGLHNFLKDNNDWAFGHFSYDLKNETENLSSKNFDGIQLPDLFFFIPEIVLILTNNKLEIGVVTKDVRAIWEDISNSRSNIHQTKNALPEIKSRFSKNEYISTVKKIQHHILRGDCYEINFCQEFYAEDCAINPLQVYQKLSQLSPNPFAAFYKLDDTFLLCSSPERYLKRIGDKIFSQPIKGTSKRNLKDKTDDERNKKYLTESKKELSENVMVVDLVRNDLSKICIEGSVTVDELFSVYSFPQVHQMISTVSGIINKEINFSEIFRSTFPMGSMTGVPKKRVMEIIEQYEKTRRGLFSGAIGYIMPHGDFDFNVVIRSILYNSTKKYVSMQAGSGITFYSEAEKEYEECMIKMEAMKKVLE